MTKYKAYPEYKDSGVEWLGGLPAHWPMKKLSWYFSAEKGKKGQLLTKEYCGSHAGIYPVYSGQTENNGTMGFIDSYEFNTEEDGVLFSTTVGAKAMSLNHLKGKFSLSQNCMIISPRNKNARIRFFFYHFQPLFQHERALIPEHMQASFRMEDLYQYSIALPPKNEQLKIAKFLDHETAKIDNLIEKQQQLIELLKEKRQAVISHAVTKGLNPDVPMKDSGVEWLGEVPEHWQIKRCKNLFDFVTSGSRGWAGFYSDEGDLFFRIMNLTRDSINPKLDSIQYVTPPKGSEGERSQIKENDILISITADLGSVCTADKSISGGYVSQHVALCRPGGLVSSSRWLAYFVLSDTAKEQLQGAGYGGTKVQLSLEDIRDLYVAYPPKREQEQIALYLDKRLIELDNLDHRAHNLIELLKERRTALISAAVTGKIDVRDWVAPDTQDVEAPQEATA